MNTVTIKKYRCPEDATSSSKMKMIYSGKPRLRDKLVGFPNEVLFCSNCNRLYRWKDLREMGIVHFPIKNRE